MENNNNIKVVKIISDESIVLNIGKNGEIDVGNTFDILSENGVDVIDPDTKECLGRIKYIKASVIVTTVYDKMCVCQSNNYYSNYNYHVLTAIQTLSNLNGQRIPLNVDSSQISGGFERMENEPIRIGDKAVKTN